MSKMYRVYSKIDNQGNECVQCRLVTRNFDAAGVNYEHDVITSDTLDVISRMPGAVPVTSAPVVTVVEDGVESVLWAGKDPEKLLAVKREAKRSRDLAPA